MRTVVDTNVFVSGIFWKGRPHQLLLLGSLRGIPILSPAAFLQRLLHDIA